MNSILSISDCLDLVNTLLTPSNIKLDVIKVSQIYNHIKNNYPDFYISLNKRASDIPLTLVQIKDYLVKV